MLSYVWARLNAQQLKLSKQSITSADQAHIDHLPDVWTLHDLSGSRDHCMVQRPAPPRGNAASRIIENDPLGNSLL